MATLLIFPPFLSLHSTPSCSHGPGVEPPQGSKEVEADVNEMDGMTVMEISTKNILEELSVNRRKRLSRTD